MSDGYGYAGGGFHTSGLGYSSNMYNGGGGSPMMPAPSSALRSAQQGQQGQQQHHHASHPLTHSASSIGVSSSQSTGHVRFSALPQSHSVHGFLNDSPGAPGTPGSKTRRTRAKSSRKVITDPSGGGALDDARGGGGDLAGSGSKVRIHI